MRDEAADTPLWMPMLGLVLLLLGAFAVIWQASTADEEAVVEPTADAPAEAAPAEAAEDAPAPAAAPAAAAPAVDEHAGHGH